MAKVKMTLTGMDALQRALKTAPEAVQDHAAAAVQTTAFAIAQRARALVPVKTGALKSAITSAAIKTNGRVGLSGAKGEKNPAFYWRFVEFGTRHMPARPFFRPAADAEAEAFVARVREIGPALERDLASSRFV
jgi:HK97 gp10 family phage protein